MNNTYGNVKSAVINPLKDVEIFYHYRPTLNSEDTAYRDFRKIEEVNSVFTTTTISEATAPLLSLQYLYVELCSDFWSNL